MEEEEEEGLFKADAVNEEDPERDRARRRRRRSRKGCSRPRSELRGGLRARPRYPGVEDLFRRATFLRETHPYLIHYLSMLLRETHPYPSMLLHCLSTAVSASASERRTDVRAPLQPLGRRSRRCRSAGSACLVPAGFLGVPLGPG